MKALITVYTNLATSANSLIKLVTQDVPIATAKALSLNYRNCLSADDIQVQTFDSDGFSRRREQLIIQVDVDNVPNWSPDVLNERLDTLFEAFKKLVPVGVNFGVHLRQVSGLYRMR